jgi:hypothetical protein
MHGWIGVDLDGTLAHDDGWKGPEHIGPPIPAMLARVQAWRAAGQRVKIFTARAQPADYADHVRGWLQEHGLGDLEVTNVKDFGCLQLWDDRAIQVRVNTGQRADGLE